MYFQALTLRLNSSLMRRPSTPIRIYLYRKGRGIVPNAAGVFKRLHTKANFSLDAAFNIKRSEIKALDKPSLRCDESEKRDQSFSKCVGRFLEKNLNCSFRTLMSDPNKEPCNAEKLNLTQKNIRDAYNDTTHVFNRINMIERREIFEMTGCMPSCSKSIFELKPLNEQTHNGKEEVRLRFTYPTGEYESKEEYYIYDAKSFVADIGGYLGLLLGYSLLSLYHMASERLLDFKQ